MSLLYCPRCGDECQTMPSGPEGTWFEGECGTCQCGAKLVVDVDSSAETAYLVDEEE